ncbi:MAG: hypothetical protein JSS02_26955 [Planctomycetes bacterium]|nr:hypothetical protein [Planctomycetota bacterium]
MNTNSEHTTEPNSRRLGGWRWVAVGTVASLATAFCLTTDRHAHSTEPLTNLTAQQSVVKVATAAAIGADDKSGTFKGVVQLKGKAPERKTLVKKGDGAVKDAPVCAAENVLSDDFVVNDKDNGVANVVIYLKKAPEGYKAGSVPEEPAVLDQVGCRFMPHVLGLRVNQKLLLKNDDAAAHNTNITPVRNTGFNQLVSPKNRDGIEFKFTKPEATPIPVKCDLHPWMKAYQIPLDHPFFAVTDESGKFEIKGLPAGKHQFTVWQEVGGYVKGLNGKLEVVIKAGEVTEQTLAFTPADFKVGN